MEQLIKRGPYLLQTPAAVRWVSFEPLLEAIDMNSLSEYLVANNIAVNTQKSKGIDWFVVGGESGRKKRPHDADWFRALRDYAIEGDIAFFMKQMDKVQQIPDDLMIRQYPKSHRCLTPSNCIR